MPCPTCHRGHTGKIDSSSDSEEEMASRYKSPYSKPGSSPMFKHFSVPKSLNYNGTTDWYEFERNYTEFIAEAHLSDTECLDALCWSLTGDATDYFDFTLKESASLMHFA